MPPPNPLTVVIVDDEAPARALIREYLEMHSDVTVVAECTNGLEAVKAANELRPDLLFLDIQMPKLDGFEVLDLIGRGAAGVVFTRAYDDHALGAFEAHRVAGRSYLKEQTLGELEGQLAAKGFLRIHRRYILNVSRLAKIELSEKDSRVAVLHDKTELPISRSGYVKLRAVL